MKWIIFSYIIWVSFINANDYPPNRIYGKITKENLVVNNANNNYSVKIFKNNMFLSEVLLKVKNNNFYFDIYKSNNINENDLLTIQLFDTLTPHKSSNVIFNKGDVKRIDFIICDTGYKGSNCSECIDEYQDNNSDGICRPMCSITNTDCLNGSCSDVSGFAICECVENYSGTTCSTCVRGYQDNDNNGTCILSCKSTTCNNHGICDDTLGFSKCSCENGYSGDFCETCDEGYQDNNNNGVCTLSCQNTTCNNHGLCNDLSGIIQCICEDGYSGDFCETCSVGYQDNNNDGTCKSSCSSNSCNNLGICDDSSGKIICECKSEYSGDFCETCSIGYQDNNNDGVCRESCDLKDFCSSHGVCTDETGVVECNCNIAYDGESCNICSNNFQDYNNNGICNPKCNQDSCSGYGDCDDSEGDIVCDCIKGYRGVNCSECDDFYEVSESDSRICVTKDTQTVYEDAEDGLVSRWDFSSGDIKNIEDKKQLNSKVISFTGENTVFKFLNIEEDDTSINNTSQFILNFDIQSELFEFIVIIKASNNSIYNIIYTNKSDFINSNEKKYIKLYNLNPYWNKIRRNLKSDFKNIIPDLEVDSVLNFKLIGNAKVDNIMLVNYIDEDIDLIPDSFEKEYALNNKDIDPNKDNDNDGLSNIQEYLWKTNINNKDSDSDGLSDFEEVNSNSNPLIKEKTEEKDDSFLGCSYSSNFMRFKKEVVLWMFLLFVMFILFRKTIKEEK